ncbi:MAG TPA: septal ring lytic transglycosylase RlpA family protein [Candidatus Sulfotelmatobacter sp.]|nr:septal ring lytic transglycosylase RlpA family protein [Candidatus Sulfotelmatobacter sp.]
MRFRLAHGLALGFMVASLGAAQGPRNSEAPPSPDSAVQARTEARKQVGKTKPFQVGTASWYGETFEGKPTASGEPYEMHDMTAAHLTLPMGSYVKVTNLRNGKAVVVRVNDRGPIVPGRIIDLSYGAAQALQFRHKGLQRVRLDLVSAQYQHSYQTLAYNHPPIEEIR